MPLGPWRASCHSAKAEMQHARELQEGLAGAVEAVAMNLMR